MDLHYFITSYLHGLIEVSFSFQHYCLHQNLIVILSEFYLSSSKVKSRSTIKSSEEHVEWWERISSSLPAANEFWGKVIFLLLSVILFTGGREYLGRYPPWAGNPPPGRYTPEAGTPPWAGTPNCRYTLLAGTSPPHGQVHPLVRYTPPPGAGTPPGAVHAGRYGQQAGGTHHWNAFLFDLTFELYFFTFLTELDSST